MSDAYRPPASIEAEKAEIKTRKIIPQIPIHNKSLSCLTFPFKCDRNSSATIEKSLAPKIAKINKLSMLDIGDSLRGDLIYGYSTSPLPKPKVKKGSSTHKANFIGIKNFVFAKLEKPYKSLENMSW